MAADAATRVGPTPSVAQALRRGRIAALRRRMDAVDDAVRAALEQRIAALEASPAGEPRHCMRRGAIDDDRATGQPAPGHVAAPSARTSLFAPLLATLEQEARWRDAHAVDGLPARAAYPALPALQPLRALWARLRIEGQTREALAPAATDAGPLNSANLVQRALRLMRDESPEYLHHLMAYLDVLSSLERMPDGGSQGGGEGATPAKKRTRASRAKRR
ncbi:DUF2894 domain-containing protein [Luteimonas sp. MHLX1A]|uniref:DUF2894 domain-containing protein n=1 Tax=Alterluteimonas muca TaxID=2878684 RepID=UPI001E65BE76|nr:DUF2894 domain-containing protein [Luteimonas sp. MHLX1A]MCD9047922.1 DUF2894 domain-containing protein [Luteimonas sp. MHLX1A]